MLLVAMVTVNGVALTVKHVETDDNGQNGTCLTDTDRMGKCRTVRVKCTARE